MNYRHIYHAGNFADVVKHAALALVIERLKLKDTPFRVIDTHAGVGSYDLSAGRTTPPSHSPVTGRQNLSLAKPRQIGNNGSPEPRRMPWPRVSISLRKPQCNRARPAHTAGCWNLLQITRGKWTR